MVGHGAAHRLCLAPAAAGGEVQGLDKAIAALGVKALQPPQVLDGRLRLHRQGQKAAVGGDHQVGFLPPLQGQGRAAMGLVAVVHGRVQGVKGTFRDAPGLPGGAAPPLGVEAEAAALIQQAALAVGQKQLRHQVFKHGARPAGQTPVAVFLQLGPAQPPPVLHRHIPLGDGQVAGEHGLAGHQVVPAADTPVILRVVADIEQPPPLIIQRRKVHFCQQPVDALLQLHPALTLQCLPHAQQPRVEVARVHRGDIQGL